MTSIASSAPTAPRLAAALRAFAGVVGDEYVVADPAELRRASTATFATHASLSGIVRPESRDEVRDCLRVAASFGVALQPVSTGKNWGYGSRAPVMEGVVLLALDRMTRIVDFDEALGYVTVEPGVTFRQLRAFLRERGSRLSVGAPGGTADASVVGNALERGVLQGLDPDRARAIGGLEVVLPSGSVLRTGMGGVDGARAAPVHRWGVGPALDGLFVQSSLGVVTAMTVWLRETPAFHRHLQFVVGHVDQLGATIAALRQLRREGTIETSIGLHNDFKVMSLVGRYPFALTAGRTPLPDDLRRRAIDAIGGGAWFGEAAIHGASPEIVSALASRIESVLAPVVTRLELSPMNAPGPIFGDEDAAGSLAQAYWRKSDAPTAAADPDRDGCGVIWHTPVAPLDAGAIRECARIASELLTTHGFEPALSVIAIDARCAYVVVSILFDRAVPDEDARAVAAHRALADALGSAGFPPYRLGLLDVTAEPPGDPESHRILDALKRQLDPRGVLAPGRYDPR